MTLARMALLGEKPKFCLLILLGLNAIFQRTSSYKRILNTQRKMENKFKLWLHSYATSLEISSTLKIIPHLRLFEYLE